ncbi:hypothetical protein XAP412_690035 [Xanthomonas phaseoli pv. phaseoli]|uniref:Secreted protein n=1 Tax=Xanthomonas campestris pv. phaseoli TaxID=317013 RepID=A0AB38E3F3_XANCH|nr:hypothetical protein XAP6984_730036 [Xanthomonas phaseoli pv. phaseoli]SON88875.1 hypothetical protein XAP412_690035 [Xanthomonas phaseoli pv. phaseoli]SON92069.1 hypothetical protein XAP7430_690035 [Xanthomonas phaseoli pv. phaseoli]SOO28948.1 hypothetical protein XAP6164_2940008 [Xanthomonas phaseoli pv. phaseoli]
MHWAWCIPRKRARLSQCDAGDGVAISAGQRPVVSLGAQNSSAAANSQPTVRGVLSFRDKTTSKLSGEGAAPSRSLRWL